MTGHKFRFGIAAFAVAFSPLAASAQLIPFGKGLGTDAAADLTPHVDLTVMADAEAVPAGGKVTLGFQFKLDDKWHIYWRNHGASGLPPRIQWELPEGFKARALLHPAPHLLVMKEVGTMYVHDGEPVLLAEITVPADAPVGKKVELKGEISWLVCQVNCLPGEQKFNLSVSVIPAGQTRKPAHHDVFAAARAKLPIPGEKAKYVKVAAKLNVDKVRPKDKFEVAIVLEVKAGHHIQSNKPLDKNLVPTQVFLDAADGLETGDPVFPPHKVRASPIGKVAEFGGRVVIKIPVQADNELEGDSGKISGVITYQACTDAGTCFAPESFEWAAAVPFAKPGEKVAQVNGALFAVAATPPGDESKTDTTAKTGGFTLDQEIKPQESGGNYSAWVYFVMALAGGLFLNITPCVLPVISIKILSFAQQAGEDPRRVSLINLVFSAGLVSVFLVLATLAVFLGIGWGGLFQFKSFNIVMATVVFAMGLSFFGVFEIPVPGWASRAGGVEREGLPGVFLKGILATLLATPCAGPLMGAVLFWSIKQSVPVTYLVFACIGLGMALPYLLAAINPGVVKWLPKPGAWMEKLKQFMGFLLMATTVYFLYVLPDTHVIWTAAFLVVVGLAAWMSGQLVNFNTAPPRRLAVRSLAGVLVVAMAYLCFAWLVPGVVKNHALAMQQRRGQAIQEYLITKGRDPGPDAEPTVTDAEDVHLPWVPFSLARLTELTAQGHTVLVDFTADWCPNCKFNEATALNTKDTIKIVRKNRVACLYADYTAQSPEIKQVLNKLGSISVPLTAIFPAGRPTEPIILRDIYTKGMLIEKLKEAGPSRPAVASTAGG